MSFMVFNWQSLGIELARLIIPAILSVAVVVLLYRKFVAPDLTAALAEAMRVTKKIAAVGGVKKSDYDNTAELAKAVTMDLVKSKYPEMEMIKLAVSPATWEQIEDALETNPTGVMELIDKYGHYFGMGEGAETKQTFDF